MPTLTIYIPTYNRPLALEKTLSSLVRQLVDHDDVEIIVADNGSSYDVESLCDRLVPDACSSRFNYFRRQANIGGNANILSGFGHGTGEWVWILGDDDEPKHNAIVTIKSAISNPAVDWINFNSPWAIQPRPIFVDSREALLPRAEFGSWLFISANVFRRSAAAPHMSACWRCCGTNVAQVVLGFLMLEKGKGVYLHEEATVNWGKTGEGDVWSGDFYMEYCMTGILDLPLWSETERILLGKALRRQQRDLGYLQAMLAWIRYGVPMSSVMAIARGYVYNHAYYRFGLYDRITMRFGFFLLRLFGEKTLWILDPLYGIFKRKLDLNVIKPFRL